MQNDNSKFKKEFTSRLVHFSISILKFSESFARDGTMRSIADQLIRSATSIGANVVEAKAASSKKDYTNYFQIALKSANETKYWLYLVSEYRKELSADAKKLLNEAIEIGNILGSSILTMKGKNKFIL